MHIALKSKKLGRNIVVALLMGLMVGCSLFKPYHIPVQQGNILEAKVTHQLEIGMTKNEVANLLGTPVLGNTFAENYWSYIYTNQINGGKIEKKQLILWFTGNDKLAKIDRKNI